MNIEDQELIEELIYFDLKNYLHSLNIRQSDELNVLNENEIINLCQISSVLSLSDDEDDQILAYEIITKVFTNFYAEYPNLYSIAFSILSRLGNFPNRELLQKYMPNFKNKSQNCLIDLEIIAREFENKVSLVENSDLYLTDFQKDFFEVLTNKKFFSVSAPTSAGKSFIFTLSIAKRLIENPSEIIVLVVPTRALIKELSEKIIKELKKYSLFNKIDVRTVPIVEEDTGSRGRVYVLTQERLNALLEQENIKIDTCFIDEAQEIQSNRGVVLQNTIEHLLKRFPQVNLFFASPLIKNPEYFNRLFNKDYHQDHFTEKISPVGQNILLLSSIKDKVNLIAIDVINSKSERKCLGTYSVNFKFRDDAQIVDLAKEITKDDELSLIYCNGAVEAEKRALNISSKLENIENDEINNLINFIREDIHKDYSIIQCLQKGVAYHYGKMPSSIRTEIEQLASKGTLKFVFCTSTLLQGVNLPAKNIIIYKPQKGSNTSMQRADFLNLIGRAGRLKYEFQGNIWCIEPNSWEEKSFEGEKLQEIEAYFEKSLLAETDKVIEVADNNITKINKNEVIVFGKFYSDFVIDNQDINVFKSKENFSKLQELLEISKKIEITLSKEIIKKHYSIHPKRLETMYQFLKNQSNLIDYIPKKAYRVNYNILKNIFSKIGTFFLNTTEVQTDFHTLYANKWISDESIHQIIMTYHNHYKPKNINTSIKNVLDIIEDELRFIYVVNTHAYLDILKLVIAEKNPDYDLESIPNLPLYLECGTSDTTVMNLISLGLSRLTSIKLKNSKQFYCDEPTVSNCFNALQNIKIDLLDIPEVCKNEIKSLIL